MAVDEEGIRTLKFNLPLDDPKLNEYSHIALPPYMPQNDSLGPEYQTVYADPLGSKAAPTAGLHFTPELLKKVKLKHDYTEVTLHVGMGTFAPIKIEDLSQVKLHEEFYSISQRSAQILNRATHITAVGTTSVRTLESSRAKGEERFFKACDFVSTSIFIHPEVKIRSVDALVTNFHIPKSSLLMLVSSFMGSVEEMQRVYAHAIEKSYRFYSFGDAMLIL
jgi:S-adenosylmethionine:tRNA ribosyltransferase-isomerase